MSRTGDAKGKTLKSYSAESFSDRFETALSFEENKPDSKDFTDIGSPVSPLRFGRVATAATSSSSSSSGSSGRPTPSFGTQKSGGGRGRSHSGEISGSSEGPDFGRTISGSRSLFSGGGSSSASSPVTNVLPAGNICPSGMVGKTGLMSKSLARNDVLGSGTSNYGHGSILRAGVVEAGKANGNGETPISGSFMLKTVDPEEATKAGNEHYKKGHFTEALSFYDRAVEIFPGNAPCRNNRAAALIKLGRLAEAVKECEEAIRLDPFYGRAHLRLYCVHLRFGQVEIARRHLLAGKQPYQTEMLNLRTLERHLERCAEVRMLGDWKSALREADFAAATGADLSPLINALRAEALLRLHQLEDADSTLSKTSNYEMVLNLLPSKFLGMISNSYIQFVRAQVEMTLGRFENAVTTIEKARQIDPRNIEVSLMWNKVNSVAKSRSQGNEFYNSGNFADACTAYSDGLKYDPQNPVLYCNRAACRSKLGQWERSLDDCNEALRIYPTYIKALLRRADSFAKLKRWLDAVRDYEVLRKELPANPEVAEAFLHAKIALKESRGDISSMKFCGVIENITGIIEFQEAIALPGVSVVYFMSASNHQCSQTTPFVESLCASFTSINFMKVEVSQCPDISKSENIRIVPTVKLYKEGLKVKEMICPTRQALDSSLRHYAA